MPNNIIMLDEELRRRERERQQEAQDTFENAELTEEEKKVLTEMDQEAHTMVSENQFNTPITEYGSGLDQAIQTVSEPGKPELKLVNTGDIVQSTEDLKREARERALRTFKDLAVTVDDDISDETIIEINDQALEVLRTNLKVERLTSEVINRSLARKSVADIVAMLPERFVTLYTTQAEVEVNNIKAKERLLAALTYLTTVGPELDYLNEYIENNNRLMLISERLLQCSVDLVAALQSPEKLSEIADRAAEIDPPKDLPWEKYITGGAHRVKNSFAQNAAICEQYVQAYTKLLNEYDDPVAMALIEDQIQESQAKADVYGSICNLDLFKTLIDTTKTWLHTGLLNYERLDKEAYNALIRIRRCKQDVPFPTYKESLSRYPKEQYQNYMTEFPAMLARYNSAIFQVQDAVRKEGGSEEDLPEFITIDGVLEETVHHYFALLLLIIYGRITKRLSDNKATKYDALLLDGYFTLYCTMGSDTYLMDDVWKAMKPFVSEMIYECPRPIRGPHPKGGRKS